jgi:hypothetical protein
LLRVASPIRSYGEAILSSKIVWGSISEDMRMEKVKTEWFREHPDERGHGGFLVRIALLGP